MANGDYVGSGSATISATGPGVVASKAVTVTGMSATSVVNVTLGGSAAVTLHDAQGPFQFYVVKTTNSFTLYADRAQLPEDVTFDYFVTEHS